MNPKSTTFYDTAKQAILYDDMPALAAAKAAAIADGRKREDLDKEIFSASFVVADMRAADGKISGPFAHKNRLALQAALDFLGLAVRYDVRAAKRQICLYGEWRDVEDMNEADIRSKIGELFTYQTDRGPRPLHYGGETWNLYLDAILNSHRVDPFMEWLEQLPRWDGTGRIDSYLTDLFTVEPSPLTLWAAQFLLLGRSSGRLNRARKLTNCRCSLERRGSANQRCCAASFQSITGPRGLPMGCTLPLTQRIERRLC